MSAGLTVRVVYFLARAGLIAALLCPHVVIAETVIVAVGDSITRGLQDQSGDGNGCHDCGGYEQPLEYLLDNNQLPATVYNYGVPGELSREGAARVPELLNTVNPDYLLYMEGTNNLYWVAPTDVQSDYESVILGVTAKGKIPVIGTIPPDTRDGWNTLKHIPETNDLIKNLAATYHVEVADLYHATSFSGWATLMSDGLHPTRTGYSLMASVWLKAILKTRSKSMDNKGVTPVILRLLLDDSTF
jgi:lysophospholipase L1-like esterase